MERIFFLVGHRLTNTKMHIHRDTHEYVQAKTQTYTPNTYINSRVGVICGKL